MSSQAIWEDAVIALERASERLIAAMPDNTPLIEDALQRRTEAIEHIQSIKHIPDEALYLRLKAAVQIGDKVREQLVLQREQARDGIARLKHSAYLTQAFAARSAQNRKSLDCAG